MTRVGTRARAGVGQTRPRLGSALRFPTTMFSSNPKPLPQRTHSVNAVKHANYFGTIDEEVRDCKRVQRQGQEEDLRLALGRMMARVEEMVRSYSDPPDAASHRTPGCADHPPVRDAQIVLSNHRGPRDAAQGRPIQSQAGTSEH